MSRTARLIPFLTALVCFTGAYWRHVPLLESRSRYRLASAEPLENAPPLVAFTTVALGGFRGIVADLLWIRADTLQDEGRYLELVQLADWITKMEPRITEVWAFHAWNLAYNISVMFPDEEDRWRWVRHGMELLRDEGVFYNPGDPTLYRELGWLFQDKIGGITDDANMYYKRKWAEEMMNVLGGPRPDYGGLAGNPELADRLRRDYKLLPEIMKELDQRYGPLDWRTPSSHSLYWAFRGLQRARSGNDIFCDRMICQSLRQEFRCGRLILDPAGNFFSVAPNISLLPKALGAYEDARNRYKNDETVETAYLHFLRDAILVLFTCNRKVEAAGLFDRLKRDFPSDKSASNLETVLYNRALHGEERVSAEQISRLIEEQFFQSFFWLAAGDSEQAEGYRNLAELLRSEYLRSRRPATGETEPPPLSELRERALKRALEELPEPLRGRLRAPAAG